MNPCVNERRDGEWWLRGLPAPRTGIDRPRREKVLELARAAVSAVIGVRAVDRWGWVPGLIAVLAFGFAVSSIAELWLFFRGRGPGPLDGGAQRRFFHQATGRTRLASIT
jgi:hypothetical protein